MGWRAWVEIPGSPTACCGEHSLSVVEDLENWNPDLVFVAGDLINRGPRSRECLEFILGRIQTADWQVVKGNHELYVLQFDQPQPPGKAPNIKFNNLFIGVTSN
ncbi:MAG: metallophosphoesterase [Anaerolineales bacterium]|nr:metallophosphoesterase [Anaerolineales bacterium]